MNLRALAESDLAKTLENETSGFGMEVIITLVSDSNVTQTLGGKIVYAYDEIESDTGLPIIINQPMVTLRISTLTSVPIDGENWYFDIPESPVVGASVKRYVYDSKCVRRGSKSIGFMSYPLKNYEDNKS